MLYLIAAVLLWGTSYAVTKSAYSSMPPMHVVWLRMIMAFVAFLPLLRFVKKPQYQAGDWKLLLALVAFIPCLYFTFEGFAVSFTTSSQAGVVTAVMPLVVALVAWLVLKERPSAATIAAALVSVAGVAVLSLFGRAQTSAPHPMLGNLLELGAMLAAAGSTLAVKRLSARYDPLLLTGTQMGAGAVFFAPLALASGPIHWTGVPASAWWSIAYLGVGCGLAAFVFYNSALQMLPTSRAALAINAVPVVAMFTGWLAIGETMTIWQVSACVLIIAAVVFAEAGGRDHASEQEDGQPLNAPVDRLG